MSERSYTPRDIFADILEDNEPQAVAWVRGGAAHPALSGMIKFYKTPYQGVLIEAEVFGPHITTTRFTFAELYDKDGKAMEVAKTPMQIITAKVPCVMEKDAMIRKVMKKDRSAIY